MVAPNLRGEDYRNGTAKTTDEIRQARFGERFLFTSEHATMHWTLDHETGQPLKPKLSEGGTAALGENLAQHIKGTHLSMVGRQTSNVSGRGLLEHPFRDAVHQTLQSETYLGFMSLHGMRRGLVSSLNDDRYFDMLIGIGEEPGEQEHFIADTLVQEATKAGLRAAVNQPHLRIVCDGGGYYTPIDERGELEPAIFMAPHYTTRGVAQAAARATGSSLATIQVELAPRLRLANKNVTHDHATHIVGPCIGFQVLANTVERVVDCFAA